MLKKSIQALKRKNKFHPIIQLRLSLSIKAWLIHKQYQILEKVLTELQKTLKLKKFL